MVRVQHHHQAALIRPSDHLCNTIQEFRIHRIGRRFAHVLLPRHRQPDVMKTGCFEVIEERGLRGLRAPSSFTSGASKVLPRLILPHAGNLLPSSRRPCQTAGLKTGGN